ncbi:hypothetical protein HNQ50_002921 [Silvimonas terrae]|uniref:Uncharacterized protein n=1 Tax=Silvimonas terrae TaxID=300266 RepID=A0A840RHY5_9NEIS|nr:hypothetical protein [Silvimonas terrae]
MRRGGFDTGGGRSMLLSLLRHLGGPLGPESSPQPNGLLAVDCRFAPNPPYGFGIPTICGTVAGIAAFLGGLSEGGFIALASKGHLRWPCWIPAQGRNDEVVECVLNWLLLLLLLLLLVLPLTFLPHQSPAPKEWRETQGSRPTEGSPEGRHPAATAIRYASGFVGVPTKGQAGVAFLCLLSLAKQRK